MKRQLKAFLMMLCFCFMMTGCEATLDTDNDFGQSGNGAKESSISLALEDVPEYDGEEYIVLNNNVPEFSESDLVEESYEEYSKLDSLDRCGTAMACIGTDIMPTEKRGNIGSVKPSGWQTVKYDIVDGKYLYNRCHLIGYQLTGENANERNLITGTRYFNVDGMLPFEDMVADYVKETDQHVLYRVTPVFEGDNLVASGVQMEALSVEDEGEGICFNVYVYNVQPGIAIDYATGDSELSSDETQKDTGKTEQYVLNTNSKKFHLPSCASVADTKEENKEDYEGTSQNLIKQGYEPCGRCNP